MLETLTLPQAQIGSNTTQAAEADTIYYDSFLVFPPTKAALKAIERDAKQLGLNTQPGFEAISVFMKTPQYEKLFDDYIWQRRFAESKPFSNTVVRGPL